MYRLFDLTTPIRLLIIYNLFNTLLQNDDDDDDVAFSCASYRFLSASISLFIASISSLINWMLSFNCPLSLFIDLMLSLSCLLSSFNDLNIVVIVIEEVVVV